MKQDETIFFMITILVFLFFLALYGEKPTKLTDQIKLIPYIGLGTKNVQSEDRYEFYEIGEAGWYGGKHRGRTMVNGKKFDPDAVSFAHKRIPINSTIRVTNLDNGETIIGDLTDRGPYIASRVLDVSEKAAKKLGFKKNGIANVRIEILK